MRILITGCCGFVGTCLAEAWVEQAPADSILGIDNFSRPGSERNRLRLKAIGVDVRHGDLRCPEDLRHLPEVDAIIDASAMASVLSGRDGSSSHQLMEHNLFATVHLLEYARRCQATFVLLSSSRCYSIPALQAVPLTLHGDAYRCTGEMDGCGPGGIRESFSTEPPLSLYGSSKRAGEQIALEYGDSFDFPVFINRCGVMAGAGQFGQPTQGIVAFWVHSYLRRRPLRYLGFGGHGHQVRDMMHPRDLLRLIRAQLADPARGPRLANLGGGPDNARSLRQLSTWCEGRFGFHHAVIEDGSERLYDVPWVVMDSGLAEQHWQWRPELDCEAILEGIAAHAEAHPDWLDLSAT